MLSRSSSSRSRSRSSMFHRRRTSERSGPAPANGNNPANNAQESRQRITSAPISMPGNMRGMRRLEMRRSMEESHFMAQRARTFVLNPPVDMRLLDYVSDYDRNLMCPICRCPLVDPVVLMDCDHCFCRDCLHQTWTEYQPGGPRGSCPTCRTQTRLAAKGAVNKILINILDELVVKCPKHEDGCDKQVKRGEVQNHISIYCDYAFVECPRQECVQPIRRKDAKECLHFGAACFDCHEHMFVDSLEDHWRRDCPDRKILCPLCQNLVYYRTLNTHTKESCPAVTTPCPGEAFGCPYRSTRLDLTPHTTACIFALLAPVLSAQQTRLDSQEKANKHLNRKLNVLERGFERVEKLVLESTHPPTNEHKQLALDLESRLSRRAQHRQLSRESHPQRSSSQGHHRHARDEHHGDSLPAIEFPAPPSGRASTLGHRLSTHSSSSRTRPQSMIASSRPQSVTSTRPASMIGTLSPSNDHAFTDQAFLNPLENTFNSPNSVTTLPTHMSTTSHFPEEGMEEDSLYPPAASPIQHLLSLHENLREEVTRVSGALHELDARHSMLMLNENLRLKEDLSFLSAQVSGLGRQVGWLTSSRLQQAQQMQSQGQGQAVQGQAQAQAQTQSGTAQDDEERAGRVPMTRTASTALRGAARVVQLGAGRRAGSDEGRTKL